MVPDWTEAQFIQTIRTGKDPTGHQLSDAMPWKLISKGLNDQDLGDIYHYLHGLEPVLKK